MVGTHRVLPSDDIEYKDLGLLIIDEEQRFGVQHKEKIKKLKKNVDVSDADGNADSKNSSYEPDRNPGYERAGGGAAWTGCRSRRM